MPYRRRRSRFRRRRPFGRRRFRRAVQKVIRRNQETKFTTAAWTGATIQDGARSPDNTNLTLFPAGTGQTHRIGNQMYLTGMYYRLTFTGADSTQTIRVVLYIPRDPSSSLSSIETNTLIDLDQYIVLYDRIVSLTSNGNNQKTVVIKKDFTRRGTRRGIQCQWSSGTDSSCVKNKIQLYMVSDSLGVPDPVCNGAGKMYAVDS